MNEANLRETFESSERIYSGHIIDLEKWVVQLPDGSKAYREVVLHRGASAVVPIDDAGYVYLVQQWRAPHNKIFTEIPAGKLDYVGEDYLEAAKRELREETGFAAGKWTHLVDLASTPGFANEVIAIYLARDLTPGETDFDEDEFLAPVKLPLTEAIALIQEGVITDAKTISGLLLAQKVIEKEK